MEDKIKLKRCKWCGKVLTPSHSEEHCDLNDGGKSDMNYEEIENKYL